MDFKAISSNLLKNGHETAAKMLQLIGLAKNGKKTEALNSVDSFQQLFSQVNNFFLIFFQKLI